MTDTSQPPLICSLLTPDVYPHAVEKVELRETHISWILLTGEFAYKVKKPVDLGFVDFTTLERRHHFCEEELRLNRRFASDLYLDVVPIIETAAGLRVGGLGLVIDYAVRMRQFDEQQLASRVIAEQNLTPSDIDQLAKDVAAFHQQTPSAEGRVRGDLAQFIDPAKENFSQLRPLISEPGRLRQLKTIEDWTIRAAEQLSGVFQQRLDEGFVRECHGDLHLGNVVRWRGNWTPFDCIEFNPSFRWIDVMNEIAFFMMDLDDHGRGDLGWRFLNAYLDETGDYSGLSVLTFNLVYRAMVRAKVDALRLRQSGLSHGEQDELTDEWHGYLDLAEGYTKPRAISLTICHGLSGSGKTTGAQSLLEQTGAVRIRSDVLRKRRFHLRPQDDASAKPNSGIYSHDASERTYHDLEVLAREVLQAGFPVIVDATFLQHTQRQRFAALACELSVPFHIADFQADEQTLRERILSRRRDGGDASDATLAVLNEQLRTADALTDDERRFVISPGAPGRESGLKPDS